MSTLERRALCHGGPLVTVLGFGALEIGRDWGLGEGQRRRRPEAETAASVLHAVLDLGLNLIDTASAYHQSEARIGDAVHSRRSEFVLASKCGEHSSEPGTYYDFSHDAIRDSILRSRELLQTSVIDLMQIHFGPNPERVLDEGETVRAMREAQDAGHVRFLGASCPNHLATRCIRMGCFQVLQLDYSLLNRSAEQAIHEAHAAGIGVLLRGPLAGGWLTPRAAETSAQNPAMQARLRPYLDLVGQDWARLTALGMAFCARHPGVSSMLVGTKSVEHLRANVQACREGVPADILEAAERLR